MVVTPALFGNDQALLTKLLSKARISLSDTKYEDWVAKQFGLQQAAVPIAAIAAQADGLDATKGVWLKADPVHLQLQRDTFALHDEVPLTLSNHSAVAFIESLNKHFAEDGLQFCLGDSGAWYITHQSNDQSVTELETTNPINVVGQDISNYAATGKAAEYWRTKQNEVQMLLFEHAENQTREEQGLLPVNSVWFYGAGALKGFKHDPLNQAEQALVSSDPGYLGLAKLNQFGAIPLPSISSTSEIQTLLTTITHKNIHVVLADPLQCNAWCEVMLQMLRQRTLKQLKLVLGWQHKTIEAVITPNHLYQFWRKAKPIQDYLAQL